MHASRDSRANARAVLALSLIVGIWWPGVGLAQTAPAAATQIAPGAPAAADQQQPPAAGQKPPATTEQKPSAGEQKPPATAEQKPATPEGVPRVDVEVVVTAPRMDVPLKDNPAATTVVDRARRCGRCRARSGPKRRLRSCRG